ncbi:MAG: hypothetical protein Q7K34_01630 [archaeon]|nr:hypothetical protein [archaeon]
MSLEENSLVKTILLLGAILFGVILIIGAIMLLVFQKPATPTTFCGDGKINDEEHCEGSSLQGFTCMDFGLSGGTLSCGSGTCKFDLSKCERENILDPDDNQPQPTEGLCISFDGLTGKTGAEAAPRMATSWDWSGANNCFIGLETQEKELGGVSYCDSAQFVIRVFEELEKMETSKEASKTFFAALIADGVSEDFRKDFYHYYKELAFFDPPSFFLENAQIILEEELLVFEPQQVEEPGIYEVTIRQDGASIVVEMKLFNKPINPSAFYYFPIDGELGLNRREDETQPDRVGYGTGFSGDTFVFGGVTIDQNVISTNRNVSVRKINSFFEANVEKRGYALDLDLEKGTLDVYASTPNGIMIDFSTLEGDAKRLGAPFYLINGDTKEIMAVPQNVSEWRFLYSKNHCSEKEAPFLGKTFTDTVLENNECFTATGPSSVAYPSVLSEFGGPNADAVIGTVIYATDRFVLQGDCGTKIISPEESPEPGNSAFINHVAVENDVEFGKISLGEKCIYDEPQGKKAVVFWNENHVLNDFPTCSNCACVSDELVSRIIATGSKQEVVYPGVSVSFWVQFDVRSPISQADIELFVKKPDGKEIRESLSFFDNGSSNDFAYNDGIYGSTIPEGFKETGEYYFYFRAKDVYGNEMESKPAVLRVVERSACEIIHFGGELDKQLNIFIVGDNWAENPSDYLNEAVEAKNGFLKTPPVDSYQGAINIITINGPADLGCTESDRYAAGQVGGEIRYIRALRCDAEKVVAAAVSCGLPFKARDGPFGDKVLVLSQTGTGYNPARFVSNADLSGHIARAGVFQNDRSPQAQRTAVHELGHTFGLLDYYWDFVGEALGIEWDNGFACMNKEETNCIMCNLAESSRQAYDCTTTYRDKCNLSIDQEEAEAPFGICPDNQKELNDYEYMQDFFSKLEER